MLSRRFADRNYEYLRVLRTKLREDSGWEWRGVRGWMFANEFPFELAGLAASYLPALADNYLVDREDVRDPFQQRPHNLYRITQLGIDLLSEWELAQRCAPSADDATTTTVRPPQVRSEVERETIFIARHQWDGLAFLQTREPVQWFTAAEVRQAVGRFLSNDAYLLVDRSLWDAAKMGAGERRYRTSQLGRYARLRDGETNPLVAMVHVPGIVAAAASVRVAGDSPKVAHRHAGPVSGG